MICHKLIRYHAYIGDTFLFNERYKCIIVSNKAGLFSDLSYTPFNFISPDDFFYGEKS